MELDRSIFLAKAVYVRLFCSSHSAPYTNNPMNSPQQTFQQNPSLSNRNKSNNTELANLAQLYVDIKGIMEREELDRLSTLNRLWCQRYYGNWAIKPTIQDRKKLNQQQLKREFSISLDSVIQDLYTIEVLYKNSLLYKVEGVMYKKNKLYNSEGDDLLAVSGPALSTHYAEKVTVLQAQELQNLHIKDFNKLKIKDTPNYNLRVTFE